MKPCCIFLGDVAVAVDRAQSVLETGIAFGRSSKGGAGPSLVGILVHVREIPFREKWTDLERGSTCCEGQQRPFRGSGG